MRYPVTNYKTEWDNHAGYDYGQMTSYGFHDGKDINDNGGGNSDLGKPLYAIADGKIVGVHEHTGQGNFGKHFFLQIDGAWGTRYVHYAHCNKLLIKLDQVVKEGDQVAEVGNTGTVYAHCHFAVKKKANGMDTIATNKALLDDAWEDPIAFVEKYLQTPQQVIDQLRAERDKNWNLLVASQEQVGKLGTQIKGLEEKVKELQVLILNHKCPPQKTFTDQKKRIADALAEIVG